VCVGAHLQLCTRGADRTSAGFSVLQCAAACCSVLQRVAVCCSVLQCAAACRSALQRVAATVTNYLCTILTGSSS